MKQLPIEMTIQKVLKIINDVRPYYKIPDMEHEHIFSETRRRLGKGGRWYGIGINANTYSASDGVSNSDLVNTIVHEVVHYQGIMGHGPSFIQEFTTLYQDVTSVLLAEQIKEEIAKEAHHVTRD